MFKIWVKLFVSLCIYYRSHNIYMYIPMYIYVEVTCRETLFITKILLLLLLRAEG